ncbi:MAG: DUF305 domain-containing protein [Candidatus Woesearchaeota archaeon]
MNILKDKKLSIALALIVMVVGTLFYFGTNAYLLGYDEEHFIKEMILHHKEAVDSSMIMLNSDDPNVKNIASNIVNLQQKEILMLELWLDEWYPADMSEEKPMEYMNIMPELSNIASNERDIKYLRGMIMHHEDAIVMAEKVLKTSPRPEVKKLAEDIISVQSEEISSMKTLIRELNGVLI